MRKENCRTTMLVKAVKTECGCLFMDFKECHHHYLIFSTFGNILINKAVLYCTTAGNSVNFHYMI